MEPSQLIQFISRLDPSICDHVTKLACMWRRHSLTAVAVCLINILLLCISPCDALPPCIDQRSQQTTLQITADCSWVGTAASELTLSGELQPFILGAFAIVRNATAADAQGAIGPLQHATVLAKTASCCCWLLYAVRSAAAVVWPSCHDDVIPHSRYMLRC